MTTNREKATVYLCEQILGIVFTGDINNSNDVQKFLSEHLNKAQKVCIQEYYDNEHIYNLID